MSDDYDSDVSKFFICSAKFGIDGTFRRISLNPLFRQTVQNRAKENPDMKYPKSVLPVNAITSLRFRRTGVLITINLNENVVTT